MALSSGTRFGPYEILSAIGAGGMGEVYRARDTRLDRTVAIKILLTSASPNSESRVRFDREARLVSTLQHPHICTLFDVGHQDGTDYIVMEYLAGETLAERLRNGPLHVSEVLRIGAEIAQALEAAHTQGVIHRDIKPGNVMLTKTGVKLMDFGLAKPASAALATTAAATGTVTQDASVGPITSQGTIVGTFQYMAPEVLDGNPADARSDIFSLGCVLYEMTTGKQAFEGKSALSVLSAILEKHPEPIANLQPGTPPSLEYIVRGCLAKDPQERWQTAHDLKLQLAWIAESLSKNAAAPEMRHRFGWKARLAILAALMAFAAALGHYLQVPRQVHTTRSAIALPAQLSLGEPGSYAISPDGRRLVFTAADATTQARRLWIRPLDASSIQPLLGTEGATYPFWSPDGRSIGFFADRKLKRVSMDGSAVQTVCDAEDGLGGTWNKEDLIVFVPSSIEGLHKVPAQGGNPVRLTKPESLSATHRWPQFLPDGQHVLFVRASSVSSEEVMAFDIKTGNSESVLKDAFMPNYVAPYLVFWRKGKILAQPFNTRRLRVTDDAVTLTEGVAYNPARFVAEYSISPSVLLYTSSAHPTQLTWLNFEGREIANIADVENISRVVLSPDETRAAFVTNTSGASDIWISDLSRGTATRLTFGTGDSDNPVWSPDGRQIAYRSTEQGPEEIVIKSSTGAGSPRFLALGDGDKQPEAWSPDGKYLFFGFRPDPQHGGVDQYAISVNDPGAKPFPVIATPANEFDGAVSPDGRLFAYTSDESGKTELYVTSFPDSSSGRWQVSSGGEVASQWLGGVVVPLTWIDSGRKLLYSLRAPNLKVMQVEITSRSGQITFGTPHEVVVGLSRSGTIAADITKDGKRLLTVRQKGSSLPLIQLVENWSADLKRK